MRNKILLSLISLFLLGCGPNKMPDDKYLFDAIDRYIKKKAPNIPNGNNRPNINNKNNDDHSSFSVYRKEDLKKTFEDLAGLDDIKESLGQIVSYLQDPINFKRLGAKPPMGVLLYGPPGTGKTEIARALAGEVVKKVPKTTFIVAKGSQFDYKYVGVGANKIRELFDLARENKPAIIFIDEIDAVARKRSSKDNQTVNEFLAQVDGFDEEDRKDIFIIGATNLPDNIDPAVLRPGRIDRKIEVGLPNGEARKVLLQHFFTYRKPEITGIDINWLVNKTGGWSAAQLENLVNEARLLATQKDDPHVAPKHFQDVLNNL